MAAIRKGTVLAAASIICVGWAVGILRNSGDSAPVCFAPGIVEAREAMKQANAIAEFRARGYSLTALRDPRVLPVGEMVLTTDAEGEHRFSFSGFESHFPSGRVCRIITKKDLPAVVQCDKDDEALAEQVATELGALHAAATRRGLTMTLPSVLIVCSAARNVMRLWDRGFLGGQNLVCGYEQFGNLDTRFAIATIVAQGVIGTKPCSWDLPRACRVWELAQSLAIDANGPATSQPEGLNEPAVLVERAAFGLQRLPTEAAGGTTPEIRPEAKVLRDLARVRAYGKHGAPAALQSGLIGRADYDDTAQLLVESAVAANSICPHDVRPVATEDGGQPPNLSRSILVAATYGGFLEDCGCKGRKIGGLLRLLDEWRSAVRPTVALGEITSGPQTARYSPTISRFMIEQMLDTCSAYVPGINELAFFEATGWLDEPMARQNIDRIVMSNVVPRDGHRRWARYVDLNDGAKKTTARVCGFFSPWSTSYFGCVRQVMDSFCILDPEQVLHEVIAETPAGVTLLVCGNWVPRATALRGVKREVIVVCNDPRGLTPRWEQPPKDGVANRGRLGDTPVVAASSFQYGYCEIGWTDSSAHVRSVELLGDPKSAELIGRARTVLEGDKAGAAAHVALSAAQSATLDAGAVYVGSETCGSCHPGQLGRWRTSPHASSMLTLEGLQRHRIPTCVICHVTGFGVPSGDDGQLSLHAVTCEACHGAGNLHAKQPTKASIIGRPGLSECIGCHEPEHSDMLLSPSPYLEKARAICSGK